MSTKTTTRPTTTQTGTPRLNRMADRCDRCRAEAFVAVRVPGAKTELLFCGHHYRAHEQHIAASGYAVHDERHLINTQPSVSANKL